MGSQKGSFLVEFLIATTIISIATLGYIKYQSDVHFFQHEQYIKYQFLHASNQYQNLLNQRVINQSISFTELKNYAQQFGYENCLDNEKALIKELHYSFCHILRENRNARIDFKICEDNKVCMQYTMNRFVEKECNENTECFERKMWGVETESNILKLKKGHYASQ